MKKTLGGDRIGSGKKIQVELHGYERSTHDMGYLWRSTMSSGTLVPFLCEVALPGDTFDINLDLEMNTHPTIGPLFASYKCQLDIYQCPIRLYQGQLHNNKLGIGMNMAAIKLPQLELLAIAGGDIVPQDIDNTQINPSCILSYLGIRGIGIPGVEDQNRRFNALPFLSYWDIYKNYYANKQEEIGAVIHTASPALITTVDSISFDGDTIPAVPATPENIVINANEPIIVAFTGTTPVPSQIIFATSLGDLSLQDLITNQVIGPAGVMSGYFNYAKYGAISIYSWRYLTALDLQSTTPIVSTFDLSNLDAMREAILAETALTIPFIVNTDGGMTPYTWVLESSNGFPNALNSQEGLAIKTYQSDLFNNWLSTEWIDGTGGINDITSIDTSGGSFSIDTLNLSKKVYDMLNRIAVSGGSYDDWMDAVYTHDRYVRAETPMYMGGLIKELVFQEVVSNAQTEGEGGTKPLGTLGGKGIMAKKHKGGKVTIKVDEPSYIMGIISLTPRVDYSQGNKWDTHLQTMDDFHKPALDEIGFQELITEQMAWWDTTWDAVNSVWVQKSAGKQPAWINYMTNVNQTRGNFAIADNEMFMTLNRRYEPALGGINDLTTYIDPAKFNFIFADTSRDSQNFWAQIAVDITARRKMSAKVMPNL